MDSDELIDALAAEGGLLVAAVERGDPDAPVPTCPEWTLRELVRHVGGIHRWATRIVSERATGPIEESLETVAGGWPEDQDLAAWCRAGHLLLVDALHTAPVDLDCWTFLRAPSPRAFWARRQLHETTIHRVDAEMVSGPASPVPPAHAADGIDELLTGFLPRRSSRLRPTTPRTLAVQPTDAGTGTAWLVTAGPDGATTERVAADADLVVRGPASDLFLLLWNRRDAVRVDVSGDATLLDLWRTNVQVVFR